HQAPDILAEVLKIKKSHQKIVSFAAETETTKQVFMEKMNRKTVDLMVGNKVSNGLIGDQEVQGFQKNQGQYWFIKKDSIDGPKELTKSQLSQKLLTWYQGQSL